MWRRFLLYPYSCEEGRHRPELTRLGVNYGRRRPGDTAADCSVRVQAEVRALRAQALLETAPEHAHRHSADVHVCAWELHCVQCIPHVVWGGCRERGVTL